MRPGSALAAPPRWTRDELEAARQAAVALFRRERLDEPQEAYLQAFAVYEARVADLLQGTADLLRLDAEAYAVVADPQRLEVLRYLAAPPISADDLKTLTDAPSLSPRSFAQDGDLVRRVTATIVTVLDRRRFPWLAGRRPPSDAERRAAVVGTAALLAASRVGTVRRNLGKTAQEGLVRDALRAEGLQEVKPRRIAQLGDAPRPGTFCGECSFGSRKADIVAGLPDGRILPIECKVSNSETNSIKRLNNDAAAKAETWRDEFGSIQVVPAAVLGGVYNLRHLESAQERGLTLFWAHDLESLVGWVRGLTPAGTGTSGWLPGMTAS